MMRYQVFTQSKTILGFKGTRHRPACALMYYPRKLASHGGCERQMKRIVRTCRLARDDDTIGITSESTNVSTYPVKRND